jgi:hypothetical protein
MSIPTKNILPRDLSVSSEIPKLKQAFIGAKIQIMAIQEDLNLSDDERPRRGKSSCLVDCPSRKSDADEHM